MVLSFFFSGRNLLKAYPIALLLASGCATIVNGTKQPIMFATEPAGAEIAYAGSPYVTPCLIRVSRGYRAQRIEVYKSGFAPETVELKPQTGGWLFGNFLFGGFVGLIVDSVTAANQYYKEDNVNLPLMPVSAESAMCLDEEWAAKKLKDEAEAQRRRHQARESASDWPKAR